MPTIEENIARYDELLGSIEREGISTLMSYMHNRTDFYTAPASTRFHLSCDGGLVQHSLNVYECLMAKRESIIWKEVLKDISDESMKLVALLHDLCKANYYVKTFRNQKTYDEEKVAAADAWARKRDAQGQFVWESVQTYQIDDQLPYGHGEKSVLLVQSYIRLKLDEVMAIRWHMGFSEEKANYSFVGNAMEKYPLTLALYEADLEASKLMEVERG